MRWWDSIAASRDMKSSKPRETVKDRGAWRAVVEQTPGDGEGQGSLACCGPWGGKELDMT